MCPENTGLSNLEVSAGDSDFVNVIAPAALSAINLSEAQSPIPNCKFVSLLASQCLLMDYLVCLRPYIRLHRINALQQGYMRHTPPASLKNG